MMHNTIALSTPSSSALMTLAGKRFLARKTYKPSSWRVIHQVKRLKAVRERITRLEAEYAKFRNEVCCTLDTIKYESKTESNEG